MRTEGLPQARLRIRFTKTGPVRFLSHLDLLKSVERALRRADVPVSYTEGFHPRIRISFGPALPLGTASRAEWMDVDLAEPMDPRAFLDRLNATLPPGLHLEEARAIPLTAPSLQGVIRRAVYRVVLDGEAAATAGIEDAIQRLLAQQEIPLQKKNKTVNARSFVEDVRVVERSGGLCTVEIVLRLGPEGGIRPEDVLAALFAHRAGEDAVAEEGSAATAARSIERVALHQAHGEGWADPWPEPA